MPVLTLTLDNDTDCPSPEDDGNSWRVATFNRNRTSYQDPEELFKYENGGLSPKIGTRAKIKAGAAFLLSCYEHGGVVFSLRGEGMNFEWDTTNFAGILLFEDKASSLPKGYEARQKCARSFLEEYNDWVNSACYAYRLETEEGEDISSGNGFIGSDYFMEIVRESVGDYLTENKIERDEVEFNIEGEANWLAKFHNYMPLTA